MSGGGGGYGGDRWRRWDEERGDGEKGNGLLYADDNTTRERVQWTSRVRDARRMCVLLHNKVQCRAVQPGTVQRSAGQ